MFYRPRSCLLIFWTFWGFSLWAVEGSQPALEKIRAAFQYYSEHRGELPYEASNCFINQIRFVEKLSMRERKLDLSKLALMMLSPTARRDDLWVMDRFFIPKRASDFPYDSEPGILADYALKWNYHAVLLYEKRVLDFDFGRFERLPSLGRWYESQLTSKQEIADWELDPRAVERQKLYVYLVPAAEILEVGSSNENRQAAFLRRLPQTYPQLSLSSFVKQNLARPLK
jgi:hypothetical protein